jgi:hypothetical protein
MVHDFGGKLCLLMMVVVVFAGCSVEQTAQGARLGTYRVTVRAEDSAYCKIYEGGGRLCDPIPEPGAFIWVENEKTGDRLASGNTKASAITFWFNQTFAMRVAISYKQKESNLSIGLDGDFSIRFDFDNANQTFKSRATKVGSPSASVSNSLRP